MIEREKNLETKIRKEVKKAGGWSLKLLSTHISGLPDRICLFYPGKVVFVEVKTTKKKPRKIQLVQHRKLQKLGFDVRVIDTSEQIEQLIEDYG